MNFLLLFLASSAFADCPSPVALNPNGSPQMIRLAKEQANCSPNAVATCESGNVRGTKVVSLTTGAVQMTVYCSFVRPYTTGAKGRVYGLPALPPSAEPESSSETEAPSDEEQPADATLDGVDIEHGTN